ncbi:WD repeat-containing protein 73 isoform X2 [Ambystoma mexicanum]|uniref:WD repeat-containing protein 73 isoform X2 n=1 Tax=Ambystoma mexicanum TaxID=8296 RepID=UPI0037E79709
MRMNTTTGCSSPLGYIKISMCLNSRIPPELLNGLEKKVAVCVAGYRIGKSVEILELQLPQKLYAKENQGLCPERDFKVQHGCFSEKPVYSLKHIPNTSLLLTSGPSSSSLQVWQVADGDSDVIKPLGLIHGKDGGESLWNKMTTICARTPLVLHGSKVNNVRIAEVESNAQLYALDLNSSSSISSLHFLDCNTFIAFCVNGQMHLADIREEQHGVKNIHAPFRHGDEWCGGVQGSHPGSIASRPALASLSSSGRVEVTDMRNLSVPLKVATCQAAKPRSGMEFGCITWSPVLEDCLAISGFDGTAYVYDTRAWDASGAEAQPLFIHRGHAVEGRADGGIVPTVTTHVWHPWKPRTILSAATDGSLHVWDWAD